MIGRLEDGEREKDEIEERMNVFIHCFTPKMAATMSLNHATARNQLLVLGYRKPMVKVVTP